MRIMGVDSSTYTGLCLLAGEQTDTKLLNFPGEKGFQRLQLIAQSFNNMVMEWSPDLVVIEGYAFGNRFTIVKLVEVGTLIRKTLWDHKIPWYDAPPSLLKKYVTGKGNAKKPDMAAAIKARWGFASKSDDVVDAYGLARLGQEIVSGNKEIIKGVSSWEK